MTGITGRLPIHNKLPQEIVALPLNELDCIPAAFRRPKITWLRPRARIRIRHYVSGHTVPDRLRQIFSCLNCP